MEIFSENVKRLIQESFKNYDDAAIGLKIGRSSVDQLVGGKFNPSMEMLDKVCKGLKITPDQLFINPQEKADREELISLIPRLPITIVRGYLSAAREALGLTAVDHSETAASTNKRTHR